MPTRLITLLFILLLVGCTAPPAAAPLIPDAPPATPGLALETLFPPDAIQALDHPPHVSASEAAAHIGPYDEVMGLVVNGEARAYPVAGLSRYELANDTLGGEPVAVTFCALCHSGIAFYRTVEVAGEPRTLRFGVSGKVLDEALVMMDRETGSLWPQSRLQAVEGALAGTPLTLIVANQVPWERWLAEHPDTTVALDPNVYPQPIALDLGLPGDAPAASPTDVAGYVVGVGTAEGALAVPLETVAAAGVVNTEVPGIGSIALVSLGEPGAIAVWQRTHDGQALTFTLRDGTLVDEETGSRWDAATGRATEGPLAGAQLAAPQTLLTHWLGWIDLYPQTAVWRES